MLTFTKLMSGLLDGVEFLYRAASFQVSGGHATLSSSVLLARPPDMPLVRVSALMRAGSTVFVLTGLVTFALTQVGLAQPVSGGTALEQYQTDLSCAAAADAWLIGMPNGTPEKEQDDTLSVWAFFAKQAQASGQAAGHAPTDAAAAAKTFVADLLPHLKSPDPAAADKARAEAAAGTHQCASLPAFQTFLKSGKK